MFFAELFGDDEPTVIKKLDPEAPTLVENVLMHPGLRLKLILPAVKEWSLDRSSSDNTWLLLTSGKSRPVTEVLKHKSAVPLEILRLRLF